MQYYAHCLTGALFVREPGQKPYFGALMLTFISTYNFSLSNTEMDEFYTIVGDWVNTRLNNAPHNTIRKGEWCCAD